MRRRNIFFILIILVILVAVFTQPSRQQFEEFVRNESPTPPIISRTNAFAFSIYDVQYYELQKVPVTKDSIGTKSVATPFKKATYLGLFGRFWKM